MASSISSQPSVMRVLLGDGHGTFRPAVEFPVGVGASPPVVQDVNHDGRPDVIVLDSLGVAVLLGRCLP